MRKVLITGVGGFIGAHVARRFIAEGYEVIGVDDLSGGRKANIPEGLTFIKADLSEESIIETLPAGCELILHIAGQSSGEISYDNPVSDLMKNTVSTLHLIKYGINSKSSRIVYASSMSAYGNVPDQAIPETYECKPLSGYGVGKLASEGYLRVYQKQLPFVAMRMFNVYGPGQDLDNLRQGMVSIYLAQAFRTKKIEVKGSTERYRDFIYIDDVVEAWYRAATVEGVENQVLNLGTGIKTTVGELLEKVCAHVPGAEYFVQGSTPGDQNGIYADNSRLKTLLGIKSFVSLNDGLERFASWVRKTGTNNPQ